MKISSASNSLYRNIDYLKSKKLHQHQQPFDLSQTTFFSSIDMNTTTLETLESDTKDNFKPKLLKEDYTNIKPSICGVDYSNNKSALSDRSLSYRNLDYYVVNGNNKRKLK